MRIDKPLVVTGLGSFVVSLLQNGESQGFGFLLEKAAMRKRFCFFSVDTFSEFFQRVQLRSSFV